MYGGRREAEHEKVDHKESSDDEEVELVSHEKGAGGTDPRGAGFRETPEVSDAQRDEWLLKGLKGARPRREDVGRPPVIIEQMGVSDMEAAGGGGGGRYEGGTAQRSDSDVAAGAADFAGGGGENATEEGGS